MLPTHTEGLAAAKRVREAIEAGSVAYDPEDAIMMNCYQMSLELRRIPEDVRLGMAKRFAQQIVSNTEESLT